MVRFDGYEENDGKDSFTTTTLNLGYYFTQSIKGFVEYRESTIRLPVLMRVHDQPFSWKQLFKLWSKVPAMYG